MVTSSDSAGVEAGTAGGGGSTAGAVLRIGSSISVIRRGALGREGPMVRVGRFVTVALMMALVVAVPAPAQAAKQYANDTVVVANKEFFPLASVTIEANKGDRFYVNARLKTKDARQSPTHRMLVALLVGCKDGEIELRSTQNIDYGKKVLTHVGRYIFEAPHDGVFECKMQAKGLVHGQQSNPPARYTVDGANSYISVSGKQPSWVMHKYQGSQHLIRTRKAKDLTVMTFRAPNGVTRFSATADIEMTNCYNGGYLCDTVPSNRLSSTVESRLLVMQRNTRGGYCKVTSFPKTGLKRTVVTWAQHHKKSYHRVTGVPVSAAADCTREFRIKVYTRVRSGNDLMIEAKPYTNTFVKKN